ncbi:MAG: EAL domain-containing protein [Pseudomonadota bacterium]
MGAQAVRLSNVDIDNALKNRDFEVLFQPVFDLGNGALARVETFVRWRHPKLGLLPPGAFISFFESQGRMSELTRYVLANALRAYMDWRGPWPPGLSVNLALSDLSDDAFTTHFAKLLRDNDFPPDLVTLECPMPQVDMPIDVAKAHFERLSSTGARLAIEVRGRANDLLRSLDPFPFDEIKTGGSAILRFARTVRGPGLSAIADLLDVANKANAAITAVGVEDQASLSALRGLGFTAAQGNHLGKVGDLKEFRSQRINEVRALLELEPLSTENLTALFRTEAPAAQPAAETPDDNAQSPTEDALLERLNERVAQYDAPASAKDADKSEPGQDLPKAPTQADETAEESEADKKAKARDKAKALILAKRAKARAARKAAAIKRAKAKAARPADAATSLPDDVAAAPAPREMQERLSRAFDSEEKDSAASGTPLIITQQEIEEPLIAARAKVENAAKENAPSTIERAMAQQGAIQQDAAQEKIGEQLVPAQQVAASVAGAAGAPGIAKMGGSAGAYFQPGIRVGAPALLGEPEKPIAPPGLNLPPMPPAPSADGEDGSDAKAELAAVEGSAEKTAAATPAPEAMPTPTPVDPPKAIPADDEPPLGDLHKDESTDETLTANDAAPARLHKRKPFLKRTVIPISSHFWPRSWRRAWRRRSVSQQPETQAAE